jgi:nucleolar complex protein 2
MAITKQQKKFAKNHLAKALEKRKETKKIKQRAINADKKKAQKARDAVWTKGPADAAAAKAKDTKERKVSEMSVDDFFKGGFESIIDGKAKTAAAKKGGKKAASSSNGNGNGKKAETGKKRKRDEPEEDDSEDEDDDDSEDSDESDALSADEVPEQPFHADSDEDDEDDSDAAADDDDKGIPEGEDGHGMTKKALSDLQKKDPEFYNFLKENDPEALDFDENDDLAGLDEFSGSEADSSEDDEPTKKKRKKSKKKEKAADDDRILSRETVAKWRAALETTHSLRALRQVVIAFRCCAHLHEVDADAEASGLPGTQPPRYRIESPEVFNDVVTLALRQVPVVLAHHVPVKESASGKTYIQGGGGEGGSGGKKFGALSAMVKTFTAAILHFLGTLSDAKTMNATLQSLVPLAPYLLSFRKLLRVLVRTAVRVWCQPASAESTRLSAFLVVRRFVVIGDRTLRELALKTIYQGLVQGCRLTSHNTLPGINLMKNSAAELWGMDDAVGYTTGFSFIRQLAIHLRNSIVHNKNDAFRAIYNWQYVHSLDFWSCVLAEHCNTSNGSATSAKASTNLRLLIYPLVQVTLGAMRLIPTSMYFPLRFHLIRSLLRLSRATDTYIPLSSALLEVLDSAEMKRPPKPSTARPLDFATAYKAPKSLLRTRVYQDGVADHTIALLGEYLVLWSTHVCFPEFSLPTLVQLKRWLKLARRRAPRQPQHKRQQKDAKKKKIPASAKGNNNQRVCAALAVLIQKVEATAREVEQRRAVIDFAPRDRAKVEQFAKAVEWQRTPLGAYVLAQRRASEERAQVLEEARREDDRKRREGEMEVDEEGEGEEEEDEEDDDEEEEEVDEDEEDDDGDEDEEEEEDDEEDDEEDSD